MNKNKSSTIAFTWYNFAAQYKLVLTWRVLCSYPESIKYITSDVSVFVCFDSQFEIVWKHEL